MPSQKWDIHWLKDGFKLFTEKPSGPSHMVILVANGFRLNGDGFKTVVPVSTSPRVDPPNYTIPIDAPDIKPNPRKPGVVGPSVVICSALTTIANLSLGEYAGTITNTNVTDGIESAIGDYLGL